MLIKSWLFLIIILFLTSKQVAYNGPQPSKMQSAIQPSSTPAYLAQRYLCWNSVGMVKGVVDEAKGISSIVVDFHDITVHHTIQA